MLPINCLPHKNNSNKSSNSNHNSASLCFLFQLLACWPPKAPSFKQCLLSHNSSCIATPAPACQFGQPRTLSQKMLWPCALILLLILLTEQKARVSVGGGGTAIGTRVLISLSWLNLPRRPPTTPSVV